MDLLEYQKRNEERKQWNREIQHYGKDVELCEYCGGPMEEHMVINHATDSVDYFYTCRNPDCEINDLND